MITPVPRRLSAALLALTLFAPACGSPQPAPSPEAKPAPAATPTPVPRPAIDAGLTDLSRLLAGLEPRDPQRYAAITASEGWKKHKQVFDESWGAFGKLQKLMEDWRDSELGPYKRDGGTLFYPFSGPDFLNAHILFPGRDTYVFLSLEGVGALPKTDVSPEKFAASLTDLRGSLKDIFERNYFITSRMGGDLHTANLQGNLAVFLVFLARTGHDVVSIKQIQVSADGTIEPRDAAASGKAGAKDAPKPLAGTEIKFVPVDGSHVRTLYYFAVDLENTSLGAKPNLSKWIRSLPNTDSFTKAASYLMHGNEFSKVRDLTLEVSRLVLQEDTGMPVRYFDPKVWNVTLYGNYTKPIKDFKYGFQPDLDKAYKEAGRAKALPFRIGYHWRDEFSNLQLAVRKDASAPPAAAPASAPAK